MRLHSINTERSFICRLCSYVPTKRTVLTELDVVVLVNPDPLVLEVDVVTTVEANHIQVP